VYGTVVHPSEEADTPSTLVHWLEYDKNEDEILDLTAGKFYKCTVSTPILRSMPGGLWCTSVYCTDHVLLEDVGATQ